MYYYKILPDALRHLINTCPQLLVISGTATLSGNLRKKLRKRRKAALETAAAMNEDDSDNTCMVASSQH